ncbi:MAG: hypothetical protein ACJA0U_003160, partial [Salibacteraceae bacterium]
RRGSSTWKLTPKNREKKQQGVHFQTPYSSIYVYFESPPNGS